MASTIKPRRGTSAPTVGIVENELVVDTTNKKIYIGNAGGSGDLVGSAPGGSDTYIQFNDSSNFGGDVGLSYNKTTDALTMLGDLNLNGGGLKTNQTTISLLPTTSTTVNFASVSTTTTIGATTGETKIRSPTLTLGDTVSTIQTNSGTSNNLTLTPYGSFVASPTTSSFITGTITNLTITNSDSAAGQVQIFGGDLLLRTKNDDVVTTPVNIIFEGSTDNAYETTLTVTDPTADRVVTIPNADGTIALVAGSSSYIQYNSGGSSLGASVNLSFDGSNLQIGAQGDIRLADSDSSNYVAFQAPATVAANNIYTLPDAVGSANQVLRIASVVSNDATLEWGTVSGGGAPGGSDTYVQFNDSSAFGGDAGLTYNKTTDTLTITGDLVVNGGDITTSSSSATLFDHTATTISIGGVATTTNIGTNANGSVINFNNGNMTFSRTGSGMVYYSNIIDVSANGLNIECNILGSAVKIGDVDASMNATFITIEDLTNSIKFDTGTGSYVFPQTNGSSGQALTTDGSGTLSWSNAMARSVNNITSTTTAGASARTDYIYNVTSGTFTLTMPTAASNTNRYTIKQSGSGVLTIDTTSSQTIDGVTTRTINAQYQSVDLISDGSNWVVV